MCLIVVLALFIPRITLFWLWILTDHFSVFETRIFPFLGFLMAPYCTLSYIYGMSDGNWSNWNTILLIFACVLDFMSNISFDSNSQG